MHYIVMHVRVEPTSSLLLYCGVWHLTVDTLQIILAKNHLVQLEEAVPMTPLTVFAWCWGHEINDTAIIDQHNIIVDNSIQIMVQQFFQMAVWRTLKSPLPCLLKWVSQLTSCYWRSWQRPVCSDHWVTPTHSPTQSLSVLLFLSRPAHVQDCVLNSMFSYCTYCFPFLIW